MIWEGYIYNEKKEIAVQSDLDITTLVIPTYLPTDSKWAETDLTPC